MACASDTLWIIVLAKDDLYHVCIITIKFSCILSACRRPNTSPVATSFLRPFYHCSIFHSFYSQAIEKGLQKIKEAEQMQQRIASISSNLGFLTTIYIGSKEGDSFNTNVSKASFYM